MSAPPHLLRSSLLSVGAAAALVGCTARPLAHEPGGGEAGCPPEHHITRDVVEQVLTAAELAAEVDVAGISPSDVVLLTAPEDAAVCAALDEAYLPYRLRDTTYVESYFKAELGDRTRYFVARTTKPLPPPPDLPDDAVFVQYGSDRIFVHDDSLRFIGGFRFG